LPKHRYRPVSNSFFLYYRICASFYLVFQQVHPNTFCSLEEVQAAAGVLAEELVAAVAAFPLTLLVEANLQFFACPHRIFCPVPKVSVMED